MNSSIVEGQFSIAGQGTFVAWLTPQGVSVWVLLSSVEGGGAAAILQSNRGRDVQAVFARTLAGRIDEAARSRELRRWEAHVLTEGDWAFRCRWQGGHVLIDELRDALAAPLPAPVPMLELSPDSVAVESVSPDTLASPRGTALDAVPELPLAVEAPSPAVPEPPLAVPESPVAVPASPVSPDDPTEATADDVDVIFEDSAPPFDDAAVVRPSLRFEWQDAAGAEARKPSHPMLDSRLRLAGDESEAPGWLDEVS